MRLHSKRRPQPAKDFRTDACDASPLDHAQILATDAGLACQSNTTKASVVHAVMPDGCPVDCDTSHSLGCVHAFTVPQSERFL